MAKVVVIGNLSVVIDALNVMRTCGACDIKLVISHPSLRGVGDLVRLWCERNQIPHLGNGEVNSPETIQRIADIAPDYIFSIYNPSIIKRPLLAIPARSTINFHAGPLPSYRGIYTFSWAIINGESQYGVAWHEVDEEIDTGLVLFQRNFDIAPDETALSLSRKSFSVGVDLLKGKLMQLMSGTLVPEGTPPGPSRYYGKKDTPNGGEISFAWSFSKIDRYVRGLNYFPASNPFVMATIKSAGSVFHPLRVDRLTMPFHAAHSVQPGAILAIDEQQIVVQAGDGPVGIKEVLNSRRRKVSPGKLAEELSLRPGSTLTRT